MRTGHRRLQRAASGLLLAGLALLLAACGALGGGEQAGQATQPAAEQAPAPAAPDTTPADQGDGYGGYGTAPGDGDAGPEDTDGQSTGGGAEGAVTVGTADTGLGQVLADAQGRVLYAFTDDRGADGSTCDQECVANWPPLLADAGVAVTGQADPDLVGTIQRQDGTTQVTYSRWPLYYYAGDREAGDTNGQGVGGVWWVLDAAGQLITQ